MKNENKLSQRPTPHSRVWRSGIQLPQVLELFNQCWHLRHSSVREVSSHRKARVRRPSAWTPASCLAQSAVSCWCVGLCDPDEGILGITAELLILKRVKWRYLLWEGKPLLLFHICISSFLFCFWSSCGIHHFSRLQQAAAPLSPGAPACFQDASHTMPLFVQGRGCFLALTILLLSCHSGYDGCFFSEHLLANTCRSIWPVCASVDTLVGNVISAVLDYVFFFFSLKAEIVYSLSFTSPTSGHAQ